MRHLSATEFKTAPALSRSQEEAVETPATELRAGDCKTPEDWARWAAARREYEDPYGYERTRY